MNVGMVDGSQPFWFRGSVFMDYGEIYLLHPQAGVPSRQSFWGFGWALVANIGDHLDARFTVAFPLISLPGSPGFSPGRDMQIYFGVGAQF